MDPLTNYKLILQEGLMAREEFELSKAEMVIGRAPSVDIVIPQSAVSGRHALITRQENHYLIEDLNSTNGTFINGERLMGRKPLNAGDEIRLGQSIILHLQAPAEPLKTVVQTAPVDATMFEDDLTAAQVAAAAAAGHDESEQITQVSSEDKGEKPFASFSAEDTKAPVIAQPAGGATMIYEDFLDIAAKSPAQLQVAVAGACPTNLSP